MGKYALYDFLLKEEVALFMDKLKGVELKQEALNVINEALRYSGGLLLEELEKDLDNDAKERGESYPDFQNSTNFPTSPKRGADLEF